jgi:tetratricopeptide (TPR) repeat protein
VEQRSVFDWRVQSRAHGCVAFWILGYPERAIRISEESLTIARSKASRDPWAALWWAVALDLLLGNWQAAYAKSEEVLREAHKLGVAVEIIFSDLMHGWALAQVGQPQRGLGNILPHLGTALQMPGVHLPWFAMALANVYLATDSRREALSAVEEGLQFIERTGSGFNEAEMRRLKGESLLRNGNNESAAQCFQQAIELGRQQSAKSWELRATTSLARLLAKQGRREQAQAMLAEIYGGSRRASTPPT